MTWLRAFLCVLAMLVVTAQMAWAQEATPQQPTEAQQPVEAPQPVVEILPERIELGREPFQDAGFVKAELDGFGHQQPLGLLFQPVGAPLETLVQDAFVGGMLVQQDKAAFGFTQHVTVVQLADHPQVPEFFFLP